MLGLGSGANADGQQGRNLDTRPLPAIVPAAAHKLLICASSLTQSRSELPAHIGGDARDAYVRQGH